ncbi:MAG: hypothetical protein A3J83_06920 [Elusimicrobia bacterium RIFOXYA2_FULL_40_6]|nr:MAG: hypothetical protein A3J83_06920 [Elusimicrobia bacterium RIFOXYA2_FULL_40_6]
MIKSTARASSFEILQITPRNIFTPNSDGINDEIQFYYENPKDLPVTGKIFNAYGAFVSDLIPGDFSSTLKWNGKNSDNRLVSKGIYFYQIECDGKILNGTIMVSR